MSDTSNVNKTSSSKLEANARYDKNTVDNIRLRVPQGWNDKMKEYIKQSDNKYTSVNSMIVDLIRKELNITE